MNLNYEVIIIGAGPSGATLAYELANQGIAVLLIEKEALPRYKCCAGGITVRTANLLDGNLQDTIEDTITGVSMSFQGNSVYHLTTDRTLIYTVMRDKFDLALTNRAKKAGAAVISECEARQIQFSDSEVTVTTTKGNFKARFLAGADGSNGITARSLGIKNNGNCIAAMATEIIVSGEELEKRKGRVGIDLGIPGGYSWIFPKSGHLSIGLGCHSSRARGLKSQYQKFFSSLNFSNFSIIRQGGGLINAYKDDIPVIRERILLLGDAAGLTDPLTGEGIYSAVRSAQLAAPVIERSLAANNADLKDYQKAIYTEITPEMKVGYMLSKLLIKFPSIVFKVLRDDERIWKACCGILLGEMDYLIVKEKLGALGRLYF